MRNLAKSICKKDPVRGFWEDSGAVNSSKSAPMTFGIQTLKYNNLGEKRRRKVDPWDPGRF